MHTARTTFRPHTPRSAACRADSVFPPLRNARRAFSLAEIVIVMAIAAIVSAIAIPRYSASLGRYRVDLAARRLAADIALAQTRARTTGEFRSIQFSKSSSTYLLPQEAALDPSAARFKVALGAEPFVVTISDLVISDGGNALTFDGYGQPAQGVRLVLAAAGQQRMLTVDQASGAINVTTP